MTLYVALTNLSCERVQEATDGKKERVAYLVHAGETVELDKAEADRFMSRHKVPVIRAASKVKDGEDPRITARDLFGHPPAPPPDALPDPAGASRLIESGASNAPEANDPQPNPKPDPKPDDSKK